MTASLFALPAMPRVFVPVTVVCIAVALWARSQGRAPAVLICGCVTAFILGFLRMESVRAGGHALDQSVGRRIALAGVVCDEPQARETSQGLCFQPDGLTDRIIVSAGKRPAYAYGDYLRIEGRLELPKNFQAYEGGPEFDYVSYLGKDGIRYSMSRPSIGKLGSGRGSRLVAVLIYIKTAFMDRVRSLIPEPQSSLVGGLLLGEKGTLPKEVGDDFKRSGLTHILVLSGSNVTVVAESLLRVFAVLPRSVGRLFGAGSIVLFALMTGASATTVRATLMALVGLLAGAVGRRYDVTRALTAAAVGMVLQNPRILAFDISFQLSFLATLAVIYVSPLVKERIGWVPEKLGLREVVAMTTSVQLFTFPFIFYKMGEISVIALLPNLLVLPIVSYAMLGGFVAGGLAFIPGPMGALVAWPAALATRLMLSYMLAVTHFFSSFPLATIRATLGAPFALLSYAAFAALIWRLRRIRSTSPPSAS